MTAQPSGPPPPAPLQAHRIVLGVSGSIAAYKAFEIARRLEEAGATVDVALTSNAARFAPPFTFHNLVRGTVADDMWATGMPPELHVELGHRADLMLVAPASATTLAKLAHGIGDSMLTLTALATRAPLLLAPAMDSAMWGHPAMQANVEILRSRDVVFAGPVAGRLASGATGVGRLLDPAEIVGAARAVLGRTHGDLRSRHLLITAGGTREAIDPVRYVGNHSSGKMGFALAEAARDRGAAVTLVTTQAPPPGMHSVVVVQVESAAEMQAAITQRAAGLDALIMAAAVADYRPKDAETQKIKKDDAGDALRLDLEQTEDMVATAQGRFVKIGFAAETQDLLANAEKKLTAKGLDLIVANDISAAGSGFGTDTNQVTLLDRDGGRDALPLLHKYDVAMRVLDRVVQLMAAR